MAGNPRSRRLIAIADRCLREAASRELDGAIFCALHDVRDLNSLETGDMEQSQAQGEVLIEKEGQWPLGWRVAPAFTADRVAAASLWPTPSDAIVPGEPIQLCALGLRARAKLAALGLEEAPPVSPSVRRSET